MTSVSYSAIFPCGVSNRYELYRQLHLVHVTGYIRLLSTLCYCLMLELLVTIPERDSVRQILVILLFFYSFRDLKARTKTHGLSQWICMLFASIMLATITVL